MIEVLGEAERESRLPEDLELTAPGPELADLLASIDRSGLEADDLLRLARARTRLVAHQEAQLLADLHAVARAVPDDGPQPGRRDLPGKYPWAEVEAAMALRWTYGRAAAQMIIADDVIDRLPQVFAALDAGDVDVPKARVMVDAVRCLDDATARAVVDRVIEKAPRLTTGELRARLRRLVLAADPEAAGKRTRAGSAERRVVAFANDDNHLACLAGYELAPDRVAVAMERLDAIARAAKAAGDERRMDQLRADVYADLLAGTGIAVGGPISDGSVGESGASAPEGPAPWPEAPADPELAEPDPPREVVPADPDGAVDLWAFGVPEPPAEAAGHEVVDAEQAAREARWLDGFALLSASPTCLHCGAGAGPAGAGPKPGPRPGVVELQVPLTTLIGLSRLPGDLAGWGPVVADIARRVAAQMRDGTWRFSVYDRLGELAYHGVTNQRPTGPPPAGHPPRPTGRYPTAEVAAFVRARDRRCVAPGCRRVARVCDLDHTVEWVRGGESETCNLGVLCRQHHRFKHAAGCELVQTTSGVFMWSTPANLQYVSTPDRPLIDDFELAQLLAPGPWADADAVDQYLVTAHLADPDLIPAEEVLDPG